MIFIHNEFLFLRWWWRTTMARTWCMVGRLCSSQSLPSFFALSQHQNIQKLCCSLFWALMWLRCEVWNCLIWEKISSSKYVGKRIFFFLERRLTFSGCPVLFPELPVASRTSHKNFPMASAGTQSWNSQVTILKFTSFNSEIHKPNCEICNT